MNGFIFVPIVLIVLYAVFIIVADKLYQEYKEEK